MRVTVKATQDYFDKALKQDIAEDTEFEVDEARAKVLVSAGVAVVIAEAEESEENTEADQETAGAAGDDEAEEKAEKKPTKKKVKKDE